MSHLNLVSSVCTDADPALLERESMVSPRNRDHTTIRRVLGRALLVCAIAFCAGGGVLVEEADAGFDPNPNWCDDDGWCPWR